MRKSKVLVVLAITIFMLSMSVTTFAQGHKFGFTAMTMNNPFFITIEASIREVVEANGDTLVTLDTRQDMATHIVFPQAI